MHPTIHTLAPKPTSLEQLIQKAKTFVAAAKAPAALKACRNELETWMAGRTRYAGYAISLSCRWLVEKPFGWLKQTAGLAQVKVRGLAKVDCAFVFGCAAHNLLRLPRLIAQQ